jgi:Zn-dependent protease with chaperone function
VAASSGGELKTDVVLRAWSSDGRKADRVLDDQHLLGYRHHDETRALAFAAAVVGFTVLAGLKLNPSVALVVLAAWATVTIAVAMQAARLIAGAGEITPTQFAHLYPMVEDLRRRFAMPRTRVFVLQSPVLNAFAFGFREPYAIVLHSALVEALDAKELESVIGHEMGHIKFGHTRLSVLLGGPNEIQLPAPLNLVAALRRFLFLWWQRCQELSADRAGVVASRRPSKVVSALVKLGVGPSMYQHVNVDDLAQQAACLRQGWWRLWGFLGELTTDHPFMVNRIRAVVDFVGGPEPGHDLHRSNPRAFASACRETSPAADAPSPAQESPAEPAGAARLVVCRGAELGRAFALDGSTVSVGRASGNTIQLYDESLSRRHFQIHWADGAYRLADLGSRNGTQVDGVTVATVPLRGGERIRAGNLELQFALAS